MKRKQYLTYLVYDEVSFNSIMDYYEKRSKLKKEKCDEIIQDIRHIGKIETQTVQMRLLLDVLQKISKLKEEF